MRPAARVDCARRDFPSHTFLTLLNSRICMMQVNELDIDTRANYVNPQSVLYSKVIIIIFQSQSEELLILG